MNSLPTMLPSLLAISIGNFSALHATPCAAAGDKLVIEAGRVITLAGEDITDGVIVIEDGRIVAVGPASEIEKPWEAPTLGGPEFVAFPGFVEAHSSRGMDRANENMDVAPYLNIRDSVDPIAFYFEDCLRYGITTVNVQQGPDCVIGARGMIVRPTGMTVEAMLVRPEYGLKMAVIPKRGKSRATQMQLLRKAFTDLQTHLENLVTKERDQRGFAAREALFQGRELEGEENEGRPMQSGAWTVDGLEIIPRGAIDEKHAPLLDVVEGRTTVFLHCGAAVDVGHALELARSNGFLTKAVLVIRPECWRAADLIAEAGVPVILEGGLMHTRRDPVTGEEEETFVPVVLADAGIRFALSSQDPSRRSLWYQAALAVGRGLERSTAIDTVTRTPAEILGLGKEVGTLEAGKLGNVVLFSGDPLSVTSWVERVIIEGREVYDRADDIRNKQLLEGLQPAGTTGAVDARDSTDDSESQEEEN